MRRLGLVLVAAAASAVGLSAQAPRAGGHGRTLANEGVHRCLSDSRRGACDDCPAAFERARHAYGPGVAGSAAASATTSSASRTAAPSSAFDSART